MLRKSAWDEGLLFLSEFLYLSEISRKFVRSVGIAMKPLGHTSVPLLCRALFIPVVSHLYL